MLSSQIKRNRTQTRTSQILGNIYTTPFCSNGNVICPDKPAYSMRSVPFALHNIALMIRDMFRRHCYQTHYALIKQNFVIFGSEYIFLFIYCSACCIFPFFSRLLDSLLFFHGVSQRERQTRRWAWHFNVCCIVVVFARVRVLNNITVELNCGIRCPRPILLRFLFVVDF